MNTEVVQSLDALSLNARRLLKDAQTVLTHGSHPVRCGRKPSLPGFVKDDKLLRANFPEGIYDRSRVAYSTGRCRPLEPEMES
jgi:hypothetical protein